MISGLHINTGFTIDKPFMTYHLSPVSKPRMTQRVKWAPSTADLKYFSFKDECRALDVKVPKQGARITFVVPMPKSWSKAKAEKMNGKPHEQRPDIDNFLKALFDSVYDEDSGIYDVWPRKIWGVSGAIVIEDICCLFALAMMENNKLTIEPEIF